MFYPATNDNIRALGFFLGGGVIYENKTLYCKMLTFKAVKMTFYVIFINLTFISQLEPFIFVLCSIFVRFILLVSECIWRQVPLLHLTDLCYLKTNKYKLS